jgi:hypothetical protein
MIRMASPDSQCASQLIHATEDFNRNKQKTERRVVFMSSVSSIPEFFFVPCNKSRPPPAPSCLIQRGKKGISPLRPRSMTTMYIYKKPSQECLNYVHSVVSRTPSPSLIPISSLVVALMRPWTAFNPEKIGQSSVESYSVERKSRKYQAWKTV